VKHKSTYCGCKCNETIKDIQSNINNYIFIYKLCSSLFKVENGKIKIIILPKVQKSLINNTIEQK